MTFQDLKQKVQLRHRFRSATMAAAIAGNVGLNSHTAVPTVNLSSSKSAVFVLLVARPVSSYEMFALLYGQGAWADVKRMLTSARGEIDKQSFIEGLAKLLVDTRAG